MIRDEDIPFHPPVVMASIPALAEDPEPGGPARKASDLSDAEWIAMGWNDSDGEGLPPKPNLPPFPSADPGDSGAWATIIGRTEEGHPIYRSDDPAFKVRVERDRLPELPDPFGHPSLPPGYDPFADTHDARMPRDDGD